MGLVVIVLGTAYIYFTSRASEPTRVQTNLQLSGGSQAGFERALGPVELSFPEADGPHGEFLTEWWYYTGNLATADGRHFGYQLTFFRRALTPKPENPEPEGLSDWRSNQAYSVHFTLTDTQAEDFTFNEEFSRGAAGLAGAQSEPYRVWLNNFQVGEQPDGTYLLEASAGDIDLELILDDTKGPVLHGIEGYSQKGPDAGNASYYISRTRLESRGTVSLAEEVHPVEGYSWMDHEFSTSVLTEDQVGWDWFSVQLDDHSELMLFQLRNADGSVDPFSSGTIIDADGTSSTLTRDDFTIRVTDTWTSPNTSAVYPSRWELNIPSEGLSLELRPYISDQELQVSVTYWEGAVRVEGTRDNLPVNGYGYVELTGYLEAMSELF